MFRTFLPPLCLALALPAAAAPNGDIKQPAKRLASAPQAAASPPQTAPNKKPFRSSGASHTRDFGIEVIDGLAVVVPSS